MRRTAMQLKPQSIMQSIRAATPFTAKALRLEPTSWHVQSSQPDILNITIQWPSKDYTSKPAFSRQRAEIIHNSVLSWVQDEKVDHQSEAMRKALDRADLGIFAAAIFPRTSLDKQVWGAKFLAFLFLADDIFAEGMVKSFQLSAAERFQVMQTWADMVLGPDLGGLSLDHLQSELKTWPFLISWDKLCKEARESASREWIKCLHWSLVMYVQGCFAEHCIVHDRIPVSLEDYCAVRINTAVSFPVVVLLDWIHGNSAHYAGSPLLATVDSSVPYNVDFLQAVNDGSLAMVGLLNDIFSAERESKIEGSLNGVKVLERTETRINNYQKLMILERVMSNLLWESDLRINDAFSQHHKNDIKDRSVHRFISDFKNFLKGYIEWQTTARRYKKSESLSRTWPRISVTEQVRV